VLARKPMLVTRSPILRGLTSLTASRVKSFGLWPGLCEITRLSFGRVRPA
jgi:hypothetical protein